ncbi:hypothetical protein GN958_ATG23301 [Phytophthora infestans]|uniref:Uncharacterized protein n=1 Tax=Phytophthora infestans TaxID=4787 RepID=A0A8S9TG77_PHYIN|nr:hypothetical protein GN958_ATG23301 [Phytophthora infestans]
MKNIGEDGWNGGDSGDTHDIKPLAYQQETPRSAASVQSEKPSQTLRQQLEATGAGAGGVKLELSNLS